MYGTNIWGRPNSPLEKRRYRLGQHGRVVKKKISNYGLQLLEKQKIATYYNITEVQLKKTFRLARKDLKTDTGVSLIAHLERRLDQVVYKLGFAPTIFSARQIVSHKHVLVDGKCINIASYLVQPGQIIEIREKSRNIQLIASKKNNELPSYLKLENDFKGTLLKVPSDLKEVPLPFEAHPGAIVEKYAKVV
jgi:small subunit ribosomal protein S4